MDLLSQVIQLLTESPGNIVYHLVTLFALQAVFAIAFSQWQRNRNSQLSFRFAFASLAIILGRVAMLAAVLSANLLPWSTAVLPLIEQALNTATIFAVLWALVPPIAKLPRLTDLLFLIGVLIVGAMTISFYPSWTTAANNGIQYGETAQAQIWGLIQIGLLGLGFILVLANRIWRQTLSPMIIAVLLATHIFHFLDYPQILPSITNIAYWIRLGHFVAFPLWAVMAYRQSLMPMLRLKQEETPAAVWAQVFNQAGQTMVADSYTGMLTAVVQLSETLLKTPFIAVAGFDPDNKASLNLVSNQPQTDTNSPRAWIISINEWAALQAALNQKQTIELNLTGAGAGQLHRFSEKLSLGEMQAILIQPILHKQVAKGVFIVGQRSKSTFATETKSLVASLAKYSGDLLASREAKVTTDAEADLLQSLHAPMVSPESNEVISGRIVSLEQERNRLADELETAQNKLKRAEDRAAEATQRSQDLAASLEVMELNAQPNLDHMVHQQLEQLQQERDQLLHNLETANGRILQSETKMAEMQMQTKLALENVQSRVQPTGRVNELEREVETLRESLFEAEEAMAMAAAGEGEISTEWVMLTITRYSGQLEQAQAKIEALEGELARRNQAVVNDVLISVIQELRTPMTSIAGFTDLLLGGSLGNLGVKQSDLLKRIQANADRMGGLLEQIMLLTPDNSKKLPESNSVEKIDVREAVETAVNSVMTQIREKRIHLDLDIANELPSMIIRRNEFHRIVTNLLDNACLASGTDGNISVSVYSREIIENDSDGDQQHSFIQLTISDSGDGISPEDLANVFSAQYNPEEPLIAGLGDTSAGLSVAHSLTVANGGRLWVDSEKGKGSIFSILFPLRPMHNVSMNGSSSL